MNEHGDEPERCGIGWTYGGIRHRIGVFSPKNKCRGGTDPARLAR
jgi:hypothetical protein